MPASAAKWSDAAERRDLVELEQAGYLTREGEGPATVFRRTEAVWQGE